MTALCSAVEICLRSMTGRSGSMAETSRDDGFVDQLGGDELPRATEQLHVVASNRTIPIGQEWCSGAFDVRTDEHMAAECRI